VLRLQNELVAPLALTVDTGKNNIKLAQVGILLTKDKLGTASSPNCHAVSVGFGSDHYPSFKLDSPEIVSYLQERMLISNFSLIFHSNYNFL
jgi:hypothetical protein